MRFKKHIREKIDKVILDAQIARLTSEETIPFVRDRTGITISHSQIEHRRAFLKKEAIAKWNQYRTDDYAYKLQHFTRIEEIERCMAVATQDLQRFTFSPHNDETELRRFFFYRQKCIYEIIDLNKRLSDLYDKMPQIDSGSYLSNGSGLEQQIPELESEADRQVAAQSEAVF